MGLQAPVARHLGLSLRFAGLVGLLLHVSCLDGPSGPGRTGVAFLAVQPVYRAGQEAGEFALAIDRFRVTAVSLNTFETIVDTTVEFHIDSAEVTYPLELPVIQSERFEITIELLSESLVLYRGSFETQFTLEQQTDSIEVARVLVDYVGPGTEIESISILPSEAYLPWNDEIRFRIEAFDSTGQSVEEFYVSWTSSDTLLAGVNAAGVLRAPETRDSVDVQAVTPTGAEASAIVRFVPLPDSIVFAVGGDIDSAPVGSSFDIGVRVLAEDGLPVPGVTVAFEAGGTGASVADAERLSDAEGIAATIATLGTLIGNYVFTARVIDEVHGIEEEEELEILAVAGPPDTLRVASGNGQEGIVGEALDDPLVVAVLDAAGNPVAGHPVTFVVVSGGGTMAVGSHLTDDDGEAADNWTLGTSSVEPQVVEARAVDKETGDVLVFEVFTATARPGPPDHLVHDGGDNQRGVVGQALPESLTVLVADEYGNPVPDVGVLWSLTGEGSITPSSESDVDGIAAAEWVLGSGAGQQEATAALVGELPISFSALAMAGLATSMVAVGGDGQSGAAGHDLPEQIQVAVTDTHGNPVSGEAVSWNVLEGDGVITPDSPETLEDGTWSATWTLGAVAGSNVVDVALQSAPGISVRLTATGVPGEAAALAFSQSPDDGVAGAVLSPDPVVTITDEFGNLLSLSSEVVTVTVESGGESAALLGTTSVTAGNGTAVFDDLVIETAGVGYHLVATSGQLASVQSAPFDVVPDEPHSIELVASTTLFSAIGDVAQLSAMVHDRFGNLVSDASVGWASSDPLVVAVDAAGAATAVGNGTASVTATAGSATASIDLTVSQVVAGVIVTPGSASLPALGSTILLAAQPVDANGYDVLGADVTWSSSDVGVATVNEGGLVTAVSRGGTTISAMSGSVAGLSTITVDQVPASMLLAPNTLSFAALAETATIAVTVEDANGSQIENPAVSWSSSDVAVAAVEDDGTVTSIGNGTATITASSTSGGVTASAQVTVSQVTTLVTVISSADVLTALGESVTLAASAEDANGFAVADAELSWTTWDESVATVDRAGTVTAVGNGTVTISVSSGSAESSVTLTVFQSVSAIDVSEPTETTITALGDELQLGATPLDANGNEVPDAQVEWSSSNESVATVDGSGTVRALGNGTVTITAASGGVQSSIDLTVSQAVASATVSPDSASIAAIGESEQLVLSAEDANGNLISDPEVEWSSSDVDVVVVDEDGVVTAVGTGTAVITASVDDDVVTSVVVEVEVVIVVEQSVASVVVEPDPVTLTALGATVQLDATALDADGGVVDESEFSWTSSDESVVTVDQGGLVTAVSNGVAVVTASVGGVSGVAEVTVSQSPSALEVEPTEVVLKSLGAEEHLEVTPRDANGNAVPDVAVEWSSSDEGVVVVDEGGVVTAVSNGVATVTAAVGSVVRSVVVTVVQEVAGVLVTPSSATLAAVGDVVQLSAEVLDDNGNPVVGGAVTWSSSDESVVTVDQAGLVTAVGDGSATVAAVAGGVTGSAQVVVSVSDVVLQVAIDISPNSLNLSAKGKLTARILTTSDPVSFDAADVDVASVELEGAAPLDGSLQDVDGDGDLDLVLRFERTEVNLTPASTSAELTGLMNGGQAFRGSDSIRIVPPSK